MFDSKLNFYGKAAPGYYNRDNSETEIREPVKKKDEKFHTLGEGGSRPGLFPHFLFKNKNKVVFIMHFKPF